MSKAKRTTETESTPVMDEVIEQSYTPVMDATALPAPNVVDNGERIIVQRMIEDSGMALPGPDTPLSMCPASFDLTTTEGRIAAFNCTGESDYEVPDNDHLDLWLEHWLIHPISKVDEETGEVRRFNRLVLVTPQGNTIATTSEVVMARLGGIMALFGRAPWNPPLCIRLTSKRARRSKRIYHDIKLVPNANKE